MNDQKFLELSKNILKKLDKLNEKLVFHYYLKYRNTKFSKIPNLSKNALIFDDFSESDEADNLKFIMEYFPYYYKMMNLYFHYCSIIDLQSTTKEAFSNILYSVIGLGDPLQEYVKEGTEVLKGFMSLPKTLEIDNSRVEEFKTLMNNANYLNNEFKKYGDDEEEFLKNCKLDDYDYKMGEPEIAEDDIEEETEQEDLVWETDEIVSEMESIIIPAKTTNLIIPASHIQNSQKLNDMILAQKLFDMEKEPGFKSKMLNKILRNFKDDQC